MTVSVTVHYHHCYRVTCGRAPHLTQEQPPCPPPPKKKKAKEEIESVRYDF